jgi:uncharacterized protein (DUF427 family)
MSIRVLDLLAGTLESLRYEPTPKRIRVSLDGLPVADTRNARLVWEPRRVVPTYAVPVPDFAARLEPSDDGETRSTSPILDPRTPFTAHTSSGTVFDVVVDGGRARAAAFRPDDSDLTDYALLDFAAFDWLEEDEPIVAHPHDPFHRIDILRSGRGVTVELGGRRLAESSRPLLLFETMLPVRFYLPREDVVAELEPSDTVTFCAYKGRASYFSLPGGPHDIAWTYHEPLREAEPVRDLICFFDERLDVVVDGELRDRPVTQWSD